MHHRPGPVYDAAIRADAKTVAESASSGQLMGDDVNITGSVHGGVVMRLVDTAAGLAAIRHAAGLALTVAIDELTFLEPVHIGDVLVLKATVNDVGTTSMECGVRVEAHDPVTGTMRHVNTAYLVFVAVDDGEPLPRAPLVAETEVEQRRQREAKLRRTARLAHKEAVKAARAAEGDVSGAR
jgi:acyl-CoA hydrolase